MGENRCGKGDLILQKILVRLPVVSLLRFKSVCKFCCTLIESPSFIELHTLTTFNNSNSFFDKFGSFILHASGQFQNFSENALLRVSSVSESECVSAVSWCSGSCGMWHTGFNGICGRCADICKCGGSSRCWWWSTNNDGLCGFCWKPFKVVEKDDGQVLMLDNSFRGRGGGSNGDGDDDDDDELVLKFDNLGFPSCYNFGIRRPPILMVGSCNGLICLHDPERNDVSLWNPATRQFRILPKPSSITIDVVNDCLLHRLFAFGFDAETKDYNVVIVSVFIPVVVQIGCPCRVQVYSLRTDSWRLLEGINLLPGSPFPCTDPSSSSAALYRNGRCFFMAKFLYPEQCIPGDNDRFIISLDLTKEIIILIQLPNHDRDMQLYLSYLGKRIALFIAGPYILENDPSGDRNELLMVWVLNEDGCRSSRYVKKKFWFQFHWFHSKGVGNLPRVISNDGVFALVETGIHELGNEKKKTMTLYNLVTQKVKKNFIFCDQVLSNAYTYKPSLVSITSEAAAAADDRVIW